MQKKIGAFDKEIKKIYLISICGTAMGALAGILKDLGYEVMGSDQNVYPPISLFLESKKIKVIESFETDNLEKFNPDLVIIGNAVSKDNLEVKKTLEKQIAYTSMPSAINHFLAKDKKVLMVIGTNGKTTTSSFLSWLLFKANLDPSFVIGGILKNFNSNYKIGKGEYLVIEGDEYDTAFFDKKSKFFHYDPFITIVSNIEFDHADIFKDFNKVKETFEERLSTIKKESFLIANCDDENIQKIINNKTKCKTVKYGINDDADFKINLLGNKQDQFEINNNIYKAKLLGKHNIMNFASTICAAKLLNIKDETIKEALETFEGVKRRQDIIFDSEKIKIIDDFAHHPTAVRKTISAIKNFHNKMRLIAIFEPATNTSMQNIFYEDYLNAFDDADIICIKEIPLKSKISSEKKLLVKELVSDLKIRGKNAFFFQNGLKILDFIKNVLQENDIVLIMSNKSFDNIHDKIIKLAKGL